MFNSTMQNMPPKEDGFPFEVPFKVLGMCFFSLADISSGLLVRDPKSASGFLVRCFVTRSVVKRTIKIK